jgi:hypothetical protein
MMTNYGISELWKGHHVLWASKDDNRKIPYVQSVSSFSDEIQLNFLSAKVVRLIHKAFLRIKVVIPVVI